MTGTPKLLYRKSSHYFKCSISAPGDDGLFLSRNLQYTRELIMLFVIDPPPGQIPPPDRHVSINGTREAVE